MNVGATITAFIGGVFLLFGIIFSGAALLTRNEASHLKTVPLVPRPVISDSQPGREVMVSGTISERNPLAYEQFVVYMREERTYDSEGDAYEWDINETVTPPFKLETADRLLQVEAINTEGAYGLSNPSGTLYPAADIRYSGFVRNDVVVVHGFIQSDLEGNILDAEMVHRGTRESYIDSLASGVWVFMLLGGIFGSIGLVMLAFPTIALIRAVLRR